MPRRKSRALLFYLAAHSNPVSREHVWAFFWPDHSRTAAQQVLRTTLHGLRKSLGSSLQATAEALAIGPEVDIDVRAFEAGLASPADDTRSLAEILDLYRGEFLADFSLPDSAEFENWLVTQREHYRRLAMRGFTHLARLHESGGNFSSALEALECALSFDPLQEDLQRAALRLHYLAGDRPSAIRRYDQLRRQLDEELGVPPMIETRDLYQAIITDQLAAPVQPAPILAPRQETEKRSTVFSDTLLFVGRSSEVQILQSLVGARKLALIEGEPGIGKTRLAEEFIAQSGWLPLIGAGRELEGSLPYQPLVEALRGLTARPDWPVLSAGLRASLPAIWLAETARLLPELSGAQAGTQPAPKPEDEPRLWEGVSQFLIALSLQRPLVLFLDDLQWADASTLRMLNYLVRQAAADAIYFLAASRPVLPRSPLAALLQALTREDRLARVPLARLSAGAVAALSRNISPQQSEGLADWLFRSSEGNPYVLVELVRDARQRNILHPDGSLDWSALPDSPVVPQTVYSLIQARLAGLSESSRRVLDAGVAVGRVFEFDLVSRAAALSELAALDALDELQRGGLVEPLDATRYTFNHNLAMEVAYREVGEPRHRLIHRRVAEAMENLYSRNRRDAQAGLVASHFSEGNAPERAAPYALQAARNALQVAGWKEAIAFFEMALQGIDSQRRGEVLTALGEAYFLDGNYPHAIDAYKKAIEIAEEARDQESVEKAGLALGNALIPQARFDEVIELTKKISRSENPQNAMLAEILWGTALSLEGADLEGAAEHLQRAASACPIEENPASLAQVKFELGSIAAQQGDLERAIFLYREALDAAQRESSEQGYSYQILAYNNLAYHSLLAGDPGAEEYAAAGISLARERGAIGLLPYLLSTTGEIALDRGDLDLAEKYFMEGLALAERLPNPERIAGLTANLGLVARERNQSDLAIHRLSLALENADSLGTRHLAAQIRLWIAPLLPKSEARARLTEVRSIVEGSGRRRLIDQLLHLEKQIQVS